MDAPKKIWAWPDRGRRESVTGRWSCNTYNSDLTEAYVLAAEHDRIVADYLAVIDHLHHEHDRIVAEKDAEIARLKLALDKILSHDRNFYDSGRPRYEAIARAALKESPDA